MIVLVPENVYYNFILDSFGIEKLSEKINEYNISFSAELNCILKTRASMIWSNVGLSDIVYLPYIILNMYGFSSDCEMFADYLAQIGMELKQLLPVIITYEKELDEGKEKNLTLIKEGKIYGVKNAKVYNAGVCEFRWVR